MLHNINPLLIQRQIQEALAEALANVNFTSNSGPSGSGVTSIGITVPTGLTVTNSPLLEAGTINIGLAAGYTIPTNSFLESLREVSDGSKGDLTVSGSGTVWSLNSGVVDYSNIQNVSANRLLGRGGTSGSIQELSLGPGLSISGTTLNVSVSGGGGGGDLEARINEIEQWLQFESRACFIEFGYDLAGDLVTKDIWSDASKTTKLYSIEYIYSGGDLTAIGITRESDSFNYIKTLTYSSGNLVSIDVS